MLLDRLFPPGTARRSKARAFLDALESAPPPQLASNFRSVLESELEQFKGFIKKNYYHPQEYWATVQGQDELAQLAERVNDFRNTYIPWLNSVLPLRSARILEVGCGTGAMTVLLREQGADVTGIDIEEPALVVARERCRLYKVVTDNLFQMNATQVPEAFAGQHFDLVLLFATIEHMTHRERLNSLKAIWKILTPGCYLCIAETPNRLWYYDSHTAYLNFFHWLPNDLAAEYAKYSSREVIRQIPDRYEDSCEAQLQLQRWGRGFSFHEIDLAIDDVRNLSIRSSFGQYRRVRQLHRLVKYALSGERTFQSVLGKISPRTPRAFLERSINVIIQKTL